MQSIERIGAPSHSDANGANGHIITMREFLAEPRVARSFQDLKADAQRLRAVADERDRLSERAAEAELDANLAAQTFGLDQAPTWGITAVIVGALAAGMWAVTHYHEGWRRWVTIGALAFGLLSIGALRYWFLWVTAGDPLAAVLEATALTIFT